VITISAVMPLRVSSLICDQIMSGIFQDCHGVKMETFYWNLDSDSHRPVANVVARFDYANAVG